MACWLLTESVVVEESLGDVRSEHHANAALRRVPSVHIAWV